MNRIVVAGWGQTLRGDDAAGRVVADTIASHFNDRVTVLTGVQPVPEWAAVLAEADRAYFVDALAEPESPGILIQALTNPVLSAPSDSHLLDAAGLLAVTRQLFGRAPKANLVLVPAASFALGADLSPVAQRGVREAVAWLDEELRGGPDLTPS